MSGTFSMVIATVDLMRGLAWRVLKETVGSSLMALVTMWHWRPFAMARLLSGP
jgi:hypothetical protein